jgi:nitrogen fixation-related uncharacterized protein
MKNQLHVLDIIYILNIESIFNSLWKMYNIFWCVKVAQYDFPDQAIHYICILAGGRLM